AALVTVLVGRIRELLDGYDWRGVLNQSGPKAFLNAVTGAVNYLRDPATPGNATAEDESETLAARYQRTAGQLARAWALCTGSGQLEELRPEIQWYEEIRGWMGTYDGQDRAS